MNDYFFTIIMPVYNAREYLKEAIESLISQNCNDLELILIDDGSTDGSSNICDLYADRFKFITTFHQENKGMCYARNKAIRIAQGKYIGFCDHDDVFVSGCLETCKKIR